MSGRVETIAQATGYFQNNIRKNDKQGKVAPEVREAIFERKAKEEGRKISSTSESTMQTTYDSKGQLIQYSDIESQKIDIQA